MINFLKKVFGEENTCINAFIASNEQFLKRSKVAAAVIADNFLKLKDVTTGEIQNIVRDLKKDGRLHSFVLEFFEKTKEGRQVASKYFKDQWVNYQDYLDGLASGKPRLVGVLDGCAKIYFGFDENTRQNQSKQYNYWFGIGLVVGFLSSIWFFATGGLVKTALSAIPVVSRGFAAAKGAYLEADEIISEDKDLEPKKDDQNPEGKLHEKFTPDAPAEDKDEEEQEQEQEPVVPAADETEKKD